MIKVVAFLFIGLIIVLLICIENIIAKIKIKRRERERERKK